MSWSAIRWAIDASQGSRLSSVQRLVLLTLAYHHNDKTGSCNPSTDTLMAETGLCRRAVQIAVQHLVAARLVTVSPRAMHGIQTSNQYDLFGNVKGRTTCTRGGAPHAPGGAHKTEGQGRTTCAQTLTYTKGRADNVTLFPFHREGKP